MPRTKVPRNAKRNRDDLKEETLSKYLRGFDESNEQCVLGLETQLRDELKKITCKLDNLKRLTPKNILSMTIRELRNCNANSFNELSMAEQTALSVNSNSSAQTNKSSRKESQDEGYLTEGSTKSALNHSRILANFSAKKPHKRRSQSVDAAISHTPLSKPVNKGQMMLSSMKNRMTPLPAGQQHTARSKTRTQLDKPRPKAISTDRQINVKIDVNEPIALLRYANHGETVFSLTGSPVVGIGQPLDPLANVNIPIKNGIISLRPNEMRNVDPKIIPRVDAETLRHLKTLQRNLHVFTSMVEEHHEK